MVNKQGLEKWLARNQTHLPQPNDEDGGVPEEISISDVLCEHEALDPSKAGRMKCINEVSADSAARTSKLYHKIRVHTRRFRLPDANSRRYSTLTMSVRYVSLNHIKVRNLRSTKRHSGTKSP